MLLQMRRFAQRYIYYVQIFEETRHFNGTIEHMKISEILEKNDLSPFELPENLVISSVTIYCKRKNKN